MVERWLWGRPGLTSPLSLTKQLSCCWAEAGRGVCTWPPAQVSQGAAILGKDICQLRCPSCASVSPGIAPKCQERMRSTPGPSRCAGCGAGEDSGLEASVPAAAGHRVLRGHSAPALSSTQAGVGGFSLFLSFERRNWDLGFSYGLFEVKIISSDL